MIKNIIKSLFEELEAPQHGTRPGSGWISGVGALIISLLALGIVISMQYPDLLGTPEIRGIINADITRLIIQLMLIAGFLLSIVSMVLREKKILGLTAMTVILLSVVIASAEKSVVGSAHKFYFAFDWFVLNLLFTGFLFLPLERLFYRLPQASFRSEWREDLFYFFISSIMVQSLTYLSLAPSTAISSYIGEVEFRTMIGAQPLWLQILEIMLLTDLVQYWVHRAFHRIPLLWRFHAIHHSARKLDWLAGSRMHLLEIICLRALTVIPMFTLGYSELAIQIYLVIVYVYSTYIHANVRFDIEWLKPFIVTPRFHHWHHGEEKEAIDVNFAIHFPLFDRLFGTYHMPQGRWPDGYGVGGHPVPSGYLAQFNYPFKKS
jgi:sterol desaturase/sphingolipid hydroxylase (fatty acid hydroxylase superfamily)